MGRAGSRFRVTGAIGAHEFRWNCLAITKSYIIVSIGTKVSTGLGDVMKKLSMLRALSLMVCGGIAALAVSAPAFAQHAGGGHGGVRAGGCHRGAGRGRAAPLVAAAATGAWAARGPVC